MGEPCIVTGAVECLTPPSTPFGSVDGRLVWQPSALVPGYNKVGGTTSLAGHIYVVGLSA